MHTRKPQEPCALTISIFGGRNPRVQAQKIAPWSDFVGQLPEMCTAEPVSGEKEDLPGFAPCAFDGGFRSNAASGPHTALVIDVDHCDADALLAACELYRCAVYETPSSSEGNPRFRVVAALATPIPPHAVPFARLAFARDLGLMPAEAGVSAALDPGRLFYLGRMLGTSPRVVVAFDAPLWTCPPLPSEEETDASDDAHGPSEPTRTGVPDLSPLTPHFAPAGVDDDRHPIMRAIGGWLARKGFEPAAIGEAVREHVPTNRPSQRAKEASDAARRFYAGEVTPGWVALCERFGDDVMSSAEHAVSDPWVEALRERWGQRPTPIPKGVGASAPNDDNDAEASDRPAAASAHTSASTALEAFPLWLQAHCRAVQEELRTPLEMQLAFALGALSACVSGRLKARIHDAYACHVPLYMCAVAEPGDNKSSAFHAALGPIREWERKRIDDTAESYLERLRARADHEAQAKALERERTRGYGQGAAPQPSAELSNLQRKLAEPAPVRFRYVVGDVTSEKLADMLAQHGRLACLSSDAGKIFSVLDGQYSGSANLGVWLEAYDGRADAVDRLGREAETPRYAYTALSATLAIQPSVLEAVTGSGAMSGQGFLQRFCWVQCPAIGLRWKTGERVTPTPAAVSERYAEELQRMLAIGEREVRLSEDAQDAYTAFRDELEARKATDLGTSDEVKGWAGKHLERCVRIAALLWAADGGAGSEISAAQLERALVLGRWLIAHTVRALGAETDMLDVKLLACIARAAERCGRSVTVKDFHDRVPRLLRKDRKQRDERLANLEALGRIAKSGRGWLPALCSSTLSKS